jgi:thiosulfate dehydrogenase [quinone] large subunit
VRSSSLSLAPDDVSRGAAVQTVPRRHDSSAYSDYGPELGPDWSDMSATPHKLRISEWLYRSNESAFLWLVVRLWLGYQWANAGYQKLWGSERGFFWFGGGAGVKGFASAGVLGSTAGKGGGASYGWWAAFLHNFVVPNASWIAKLVSLGELLIGVALVLGLLTGAAAFCGLLLNVTYMFSGSAGVNPMYALLGVLLVLAWRNAGLIGLDRFVLGSPLTPYRLGRWVGHLTHRRPTVAALPH